MARTEINRGLAWPRTVAQRRSFIGERLTPYLYILPALLLLGIFEIWPILFGFCISR